MKSINLSRELCSGVRLLSLSLNENVNVNTRYRKRWRNEVEFLENNTRRYGRIDPFIFQNCLKAIRNEDITPKESLLLLKCCGPLMYNKTKAKRNQLLNELWTILKEKRVPLDIMHYNLLIKMYTENERPFDPEQILDEIKSADLRPNLRTYEFIVNKYCLDGDLDKVTQLLEKMNQEGLSLTAPMFDSLILGHFIKKDVNTARETFDLMKESGIEVTNSTYKNLIIGFLKNHETVNALDEIKQLMNSNSVKFEISEITEIIGHIPNKQMSNSDAKELKRFLIGHIEQNENYYNDLSNCCYNLILNGEHDVVRDLFNSYFTDVQSQEFFIKRLLVSIIKSDETKYKEFVQFLKELNPTFNFSSYTKSTLRNDIFSVDQILRIMSDLKSTLDSKDFGVYAAFLSKCTNEDEVHAITEQYLKNLDINWINHVKRHYLPRVEIDPFKFMEEHSKRNKNPDSVCLLKLSIYCTFFDQLEIDQLRKFTKQFNPNTNLLSNSYLLERMMEAIKTNPNKLKDVLFCLRGKLAYHKLFCDEVLKYCLNNLTDDQQIRTLVSYLDQNHVQIRTDRLDERQLNRLKNSYQSSGESQLSKLIDKLDCNEPIEIDRDLIKLRNSLDRKDLKLLLQAAVKNGNLEIANFFFDSQLQLHVPTLIKYTLLKLENKNEDRQKAIAFLDERLNKFADVKIRTLQAQIGQIFDKIKDDEKLAIAFIKRISLHLEPPTLYEHLIYFYSQTNNTDIGENLILLTSYLLNRDFNKVFRTMVAFIENKNTSLLQFLSDKLARDNAKYDKSKVYQELALAFVYTERFKQAIKVIQTNEFNVQDDVYHVFKVLQRLNKTEVIKQFAILVYQNSPRSRKQLLSILNDSLNKLKEEKLFQEILLEIKQLSASKPHYQNDRKHEEQLNEVAGVKSIEQERTEAISSIKDVNRSQEELIDLVDQIINKKKSLKLNVECDLIDRLISVGELEKTVDLVYDMLRNERYPIPATIKSVLKELSSQARIDLIDKLEPYVPLPLKESEFYKNNKIVAYLRTTDSEGEIVKCLKDIQTFSADLIDQILTIKPEFEEKIISELKAKKKSNLNYIWLHLIKSSKFDMAIDLVEKHSNELNPQNLLFQPILNLAKQTNNVELAGQLVAYATKFDLKPSTIQSIYNVYTKSCLNADLINEVQQAVEQHYKSRPDIKLELQNLDEKLINKLDKSFIDKFIKI